MLVLAVNFLYQLEMCSVKIKLENFINRWLWHEPIINPTVVRMETYNCRGEAFDTAAAFEHFIGHGNIFSVAPYEDERL